MAKCKDCPRYRKYLRSLSERLALCKCSNSRHRKIAQEIKDWLYLMRDKKIKGDT